MGLYNSPNMSYCAVENTAGAMRQVICLMQEHDTVADWEASLNKYELAALRDLLAYCNEFAELLETEEC